ncbi:MAG: molecular chaperone TorD family protein [Gaiella sp.]|nr:molecular chaperone TorD family protein [Gaiella sp.]
MSELVARPTEVAGLAGAFAAVLTYPVVPPGGDVRTAAKAAGEWSSEAEALLDAFGALVATTGLGELQEAYTRTFDLDTLARSQPTCYPYVGHYLFEESHKRGAFIVELRRRFRAAGFEPDGGELADHLVVLLSFLAVCDDEELAGELLDDAILPALARISALPGGPRAEGPLEPQTAYRTVLGALELALRAARPHAVVDPLELESEREWMRDRDSLGIDRATCG